MPLTLAEHTNEPREARRLPSVSFLPAAGRYPLPQPLTGRATRLERVGVGSIGAAGATVRAGAGDAAGAADAGAAGTGALRATGVAAGAGSFHCAAQGCPWPPVPLGPPASMTVQPEVSPISAAEAVNVQFFFIWHLPTLIDIRGDRTGRGTSSRPRVTPVSNRYAVKLRGGRGPP
jgi:hypothetical protein